MKKLLTFVFSMTLVLSADRLSAQPPEVRGNYSPSSPTHSIEWLSSYSEAVALAQSSSKPILILFTGTKWCPACIKLERQVLNRPEFAQAVSQQFVFLKAEFPDYSEDAVQASPYKVLLDRYKIEFFPTLVVTHANGQQLYTVHYQEGGPQVYANELLHKLRESDGR